MPNAEGSGRTKDYFAFAADSMRGDNVPKVDPDIILRAAFKQRTAGADVSWVNLGSLFEAVHLRISCKAAGLNV
jgi:hypothetical protein